MSKELNVEAAAEAPELSFFEDSLRCSICYELYSAPVLLPCGHSFCSLCIRANFDFKVAENNKCSCPHCRQQCDPSQLLPNINLREAAKHFEKARTFMVQTIQTALELRRQAEQLRQRAAAPPPAPTPAAQPSSSRPQRAAAKRPSPPSSQPKQAAAQAQQPGAARVTQGRSNGSAAAAAAQQPPTSHALPDDAVALAEADVVSVSSQSAAAAASSSLIDANDSAGGSDWHPGLENDDDDDFKPTQVADPSASRPRKRPKPTLPGAVERQRSLTPPTQPQPEAMPAAEPAPPPPPPLAPPPRGFVHCPICSMTVKAELINNHIDSCLNRNISGGCSGAGRTAAPAAPAAAAAAPSSSKPPASQQQQQQQALARRGSAAVSNSGDGGVSALASAAAAANGGRTTRDSIDLSDQQQKPQPAAGPRLEPPPKICFNIMRDKDVRKLLEERGLPVDGKRQDWVDRYLSFRRFVQAHIDGGGGGSYDQVLRRFLAEQRRLAQAKSAPARLGAGAGAAPAQLGGGASRGGNGNGSGSGASVMTSSFDALVAQVRQRKAAAAAAAAAAGSGDQQPQAAALWAACDAPLSAATTLSRQQLGNEVCEISSDSDFVV